ncbi:dTDP-glucose 4,6-dehydratase [Lactobacillus sp. LC28-10]|uniref:dTDP-glucose 4,6-dehydratase n=1 Tax=Secundilactobacillus angelensis TaxID=2722706 RepID=A0ABX1L1V7_9LACO|nr:dTDP-glucose 4,6-dehydratase [Secundilactobacillus angelensis]MCH5462503.1 dTDP-glucose 4,6-dehydratase [Secundilactobacillus angelensis]NLR18306.1 dTDP-glucose 4,6-dehydratase [Secundilactobacillus angelensis]
MRILVTGGAGFIGSNFVRYVLQNYSEDSVINLDLLTYAGNLHNLDGVSADSRYCFVQGNIRNRELVRHLVAEYDIDVIVNFAAESHVDRSISNPDTFVETNVEGTMALLDVAKEAGISKFIQISTDEVYGALGKTGYFTEESTLQPNSPYSASKASADMLARAYFETYGLDVSITRSSNNYGPRQHPEKLIPRMITRGLAGKTLPIYGDGQNVRDWLYVMDNCRAIDLVMCYGRAGEVYNIGGHNERSNNEIVRLICSELGISEDRIEYVADRLGHDWRYAVDSSKIERSWGWKPEANFEKAFKKTVQYYKDYYTNK